MLGLLGGLDNGALVEVALIVEVELAEGILQAKDLALLELGVFPGREDYYAAAAGLIMTNRTTILMMMIIIIVMVVVLKKAWERRIHKSRYEAKKDLLLQLDYVHLGNAVR